jgi:hypothetical protein
MTIVNLACIKYVTKIECDKPQKDGYEVANLIKDSTQNDNSSFYAIKSYSNEFLTENFIRPPVTITLYFKNPVKIIKISIDGKIGSQISNGFVISTSCQTNDSIFKKISSIITEKSDSSNYLYEFVRRTQTKSLNSNIAFFNSNFLPFIDSVMVLKISIIRTISCTAPCIKSLKIFGIPSEPVEQKPDQTINELTPKNKSKSMKIPSEFFDELTHNLMILPIKLPSGHWIDKTSYDSYLAEQRSIGDLVDKDPFTKKPFDSINKPIIDEILKAKIDKFLLDNSIDTPKIEITKPIKLKRAIENNSVSTLNEPLAKIAKVSHEQKNTCMCCLNENHTNYYEIELCKHLFCRQCITNSKNTCPVCKIKFETKNITNLNATKFHKN